MISKKGQVTILFFYVCFTTFCVVMSMRIQTFFSLDLNFTREYTCYDYYQLKNRYLDELYLQTSFVDIPETNFFEQESQLQHLIYEDALQRCELCSEKWLKPGSLDSWFSAFRAWVERGNCPLQRTGFDPFKKTLEPSVFKSCFSEWINNDFVGRTYRPDLTLDQKTGLIVAFKQTIKTIKFEKPGTQSVTYLDELRRIDKQAGLNETFSFDMDHGIIEIYRVLFTETIVSISMSLLVVFIVVFFVTINLAVTLLVMLVVSVVNLYLLAVSYAWGLTFNNLMGLSMTFAFGIALDYSSHIAHTY